MGNEIRREDMEKVVKGYCDSFCDCLPGCKLYDSVCIDFFFDTCPLNDITAPYFKQAYDIITSTENDPVNHPSHNCDRDIEAIDYIKAKLTESELVGYCKGKTIEYMLRAGKGSPNRFKEDLEKAVFYLNAAIESV